MGEDGAAPRIEGVQVVARVAELLRLLGAAPEGHTMSELATRTALPRSTVHRLTQALIEEDFVRAAPTGRLRIGPALVGIVAASRRDLRHEITPFLESLSRSLRETVDLAVLDAGEALFVEQVQSPRSLRVVSEIGSRFPLHCTASGKVLLAALPQGEVEALLPKRLQRFTEHTITDRAQLLEEIEHVRTTGLAYDREEHTLGVSAVGTLVQDALGLSASITVVIPAARLAESEERVAAAVLHTREEVKAALGGA